MRTKSEGDEAQKPLFRNALRPRHSCSSILVKGVLREISFISDIQIPETLEGIRRSTIKGAM